MNAKTSFLFLLLLLLSFTTAAPKRVLAETRASDTAQNYPVLSTIDRTRLAEAFRLGDQIGDRVWPGWSKAPFTVLLVTPEVEFLIRYPEKRLTGGTPVPRSNSRGGTPVPPPGNFAYGGYDALLKSDIYYRKRTFPTHFLATFPAVGGISTIVVGQAENTYVKTSTPWVITLLHEHFHQMQDSQPNFYADVNALKLTRGDQTGMWMLNYAFPYDRKEVQDQFLEMSKLLADALNADEGVRAPSIKLRAYLAARQKFQAMLAPDDYKYISFQFWKEGIARYTEYEMARLAASRFRASKEFRALKDYRSFADVARTTYKGIFDQLRTQKLGESKREVVYSFGAAEGLLLDQIKPRWRKRYFAEKFDLGKLW